MAEFARQNQPIGPFVLYAGAWFPALPAYLRLVVRRIVAAGLVADAVDAAELQLVITEALAEASLAGAGQVRVAMDAALDRTGLEVACSGQCESSHSPSDRPEDAMRRFAVISALSEAWGYRSNDDDHRTIWVRMSARPMGGGDHGDRQLLAASRLASESRR